MGLVEAFDSVPRGVIWAVLAKVGVPPHLIFVIRCMNAELEVTFDLSSELLAVPCSVGVKKGCPLSPALFLFDIQACLEPLDRAMPAEATPWFRTNSRTSTNGGKVPGTDLSKKGEFEFGF